MSRMVQTTRYSKTKDTNTALFDQNGRRIAGGRATLAPGETVSKRGNAPPPTRTSSTTRVSSSTRVSATVSRPAARGAARAGPAIEEYEEEQEDYVDPRAERIRAQEAEREARNQRKEQETYDFHTKYYVLCQDKEKLEAYPGFRFGLDPPDPEDIHALGVYKMNLAECEKQEAILKRKAEAKSAAQKERGEVTRTGRPPARTPKTVAGKRGKTPGRRGDEELMDEIDERHRDRLEKQTLDFHYKYWPLCKDKVMLEAYPGFRFGMPVPEYDDLLAVNGYLLELKQFEAAEEAAMNINPEQSQTNQKPTAQKPTAQRLTKAQKAKAEMDARVAAKRVSLKPPPRKVAGTTPKMGCKLPPGAEEALARRPGPPDNRPRPPSAKAPKPKTPEPPKEPVGPPRLPRGPPPGYVMPRRKAVPKSASKAAPVAVPMAAPGAAPTAAPEAQPQQEIEVETETKVVVQEDMETRIYNLKQKAFERGIYNRPPAPTPGMRARLSPEEQPECPCGDEERPPPQRQPSPPKAAPARGRPQTTGLRPPAARGLPQRAGSKIGVGSRIATGSRIGGGRFPAPTRGAYAKEMVPVEVVTQGGAGRSILVPTEVATADHNTVVVVKKGTNIATPVDDDPDATLPPYVPPPGERPKKRIDRNKPNLDAFDQMRLAEQDEEDRLEKERLVQDLQNKRAAVAKLRQAAELLQRQKKELMDRIELMDAPLIPVDQSQRE